MLASFGFLTNIVSHLVGALADTPLPRFARGFIIGTFARLIRADLSEAEMQPTAYRSCGEYFARALKLGVRPLATTPICSPADGTIRNITAAAQPLEQIKGQKYTIAELLAENLASINEFSGGSVAVIYLAPHNYHRVHAPLSGVIESIRHIKGPLWPVNAWGLNRIKNLFCVNERVIMRGRSTLGTWALVMVGATNVGRIELNWGDLKRINAGESRTVTWEVEQGGEVGRFRLGSTVILVTSFKLQTLEQARAVRYGEALHLSQA